MRRVPDDANGAILWLFEWIIELYGPYALVRCASFTNSRRQAQEIGMYALAATCVLVGELDHLGQLGILVDVMMDVVGPDVVSRREPAVPWDDELLIADERMRDLADFAAALDTAWLQEVADCAIRYLAECDGQAVLPHGPCPLN